MLHARLVEDLADTMRHAYTLLDEFKAMGFGYVPVRRLKIEETDSPVWIDDGTIKIDPQCSEPRCIAHEMGHGWHLWLRRQLGYRDEFGEDTAEAIRWFVEERMGGRTWTPRGDWQHVLNACEWRLERYKEMLHTRELFTKLRWDKE